MNASQLILRATKTIRNKISPLRTVPLADRWFSSAATVSFEAEEFADRCNVHVVESPYPPNPSGPHPPVAEFIAQNWSYKGNTNNKVAMIDGSTGLSRTFTDFYQTTGNLAAVLRYDLGIEGEDSTVALYSPNHVDYLPISLAVSLCGAKLTPINPLYTPMELETVLQRSQSSVLIAHTSTLDDALAAAKSCPKIKHVIVVTDNDDDKANLVEGIIALDDIKKQHEKSFHETIPSVYDNNNKHTYMLPYSSGTTGLPKGVCLSHENIIANLLQIDQIEADNSDANQKVISPLPFFHIFGFTYSMLYASWKGMPIVTMSGRFDLELFCKLVEEHRPTRAHLVPPIILRLAKSPLLDQYDLSSLELISTGAAPLGSATQSAVMERLDCKVKQSWGMSELSPVGTLNSDSNSRLGSVGPLVPSSYGKIVNEQGRSLGPNESGELLIKGPHVMMGYLNDPDKTAECLSSSGSGWLRTGDVAHYDDDGYFYITDRYKELIKVRGFQVAPAELEALLLTHPKINDVAVIQVPDVDGESGELPRAYIVLKDSNNVSNTTTAAADNDDKKKGNKSSSQSLLKNEIYEWVKERVVPYKRLDGGIIFTDSIPKSASGKILRRLLRDQVAQQEKECQ